jgi:hypothetical protein
VKEAIKVLTRENWQWGGVDVLIRQGDKVMLPFVLEDHQPCQPVEAVTIGAQYGEEFLRACLNAAWDLGMRPDGFHDARESMKATNAHLQDMRALAFGKLGVEKPA